MFFAFDRRDIVDRGEEFPVVEPIDPFEGGEFNCFDGALRSTTVDDLGLVEADDRLGQTFGVANREASHSAIAVMHQVRRRASPCANNL